MSVHILIAELYVARTKPGMMPIDLSDARDVPRGASSARRVLDIGNVADKFNLLGYFPGGVVRNNLLRV